MKTIIFCFFTVITSFFIGKNDEAIIKQTEFVNNGFVKIGTNIYISKFEATVKEYHNFLNSERNKYSKFLYDSSLLKKSAVPQFEKYFNHPAYANCPIICVSYESALAYCDWLTIQYSKNPKAKFKNVKFRLPSPEEWKISVDKELIDKNNRFVDTNLFYTNRMSNISLNLKPNYDPHFAIDVNSYKPNLLGLYNLIGNVAEMTTEKGKAKGGSWGDYITNCEINKFQIYSGPSSTVG